MQFFNFFYFAYLFIWGADVVYKKRRVNADSWSSTEIATYTYMLGAPPTADMKTALGSLFDSPPTQLRVRFVMGRMWYSAALCNCGFQILRLSNNAVTRRW